MTIKYISLEYIFNSIMRTLRQIIFTIFNGFAQPLTAYFAFILEVLSSFLSNLMLIPIFRLISGFFDQIRINISDFLTQMYNAIVYAISTIFTPINFFYNVVIKFIYKLYISLWCDILVIYFNVNNERNIFE